MPTPIPGLLTDLLIWADCNTSARAETGLIMRRGLVVHKQSGLLPMSLYSKDMGKLQCYVTNLSSVSY